MVLKKNNWRTFFGFIISAILLWLTFHNSGLELQNITLNREQLSCFIAAISIFIFSVWFNSIRAKLFWLNKKRSYREVDSYNSLMVGNFYNCLLPGNLGEGVRSWHFSRKNNVSFLPSLTAIISEKWIDAHFFLPFSLLIFIIKPFKNHYISYAIAFTDFVLFIIIFIYILMINSRGFERFILQIVLTLRKTGRLFFRLYWHTKNHISNLKNNGTMIYYLFLCVFILLLNISQFLFLLKAAGVPEPIAGCYAAYLVAITMMIIAFIPSAPGNIGTIHYGVYSVLIFASMQYGIEPNEADLQSFARFGLFVHLSYFIPEVIMGAVFVVKERSLIFH